MRPKAAQASIEHRLFDHPTADRVRLVRAIYDVINGKLVGGGSKPTVDNEFCTFRQFFAWTDETGRPVGIGTIEQDYVAWADWLGHRHRVVRDMNERSAYHKGAVVAAVLDQVLNRESRLIELTQLRMPQKRITAQGQQAEKQNLSDTFAFGHMLQDLCDGLTTKIVFDGELPVVISLRSGHIYEPKAGALRPQNLIEHTPSSSRDSPVYIRSPLANLRIEAELLMFIGQTGMNLAQAQHLRLQSFVYASHIDGYQVLERKPRAGGEVLFEIFRDYRSHFERYLAWRRVIFPKSRKLFPFLLSGGRADDQNHQFALRRICKDLDLPFVAPRSLRNTRVNWLLRKTADTSITAEMSQHTEETLLTVYERPSQHRAAGELIRFWSKHDPQLLRTAPLMAGECRGRPEASAAIPESATSPDCIRPSGCLWCKDHKDVDTLDYVWSLASFRHLKLLELSKWNTIGNPSETNPAQLSVERLTEKLRWFHDSNHVRRQWCTEAASRVEEGQYHQAWSTLILSMEGPNGET